MGYLYKTLKFIQGESKNHAKHKKSGKYRIDIQHSTRKGSKISGKNIKIQRNL